LAPLAGRLLVSMVSAGPEPIPLDARLDLRVLTFSSIVALSTAILFGLAPALRATRVEGTVDLKEGKGTGSTQIRSALARFLLIGQVALSLALLAGAGLFLRTLVNLTNLNTGFNKKNVL